MRGYQSPFNNIFALKTAPALTPVTLSETKEHLNELTNDNNVAIQSLIEAATAYFDGPNGALSKALIDQTWDLSVDRADANVICLPLTPVSSIAAITYFDIDDAVQTLDVNDFRLIGNEDWAYIEPKQGQSWPTTSNRPDAITVSFVAGFGAEPSNVPKLVRQAILLTVRHWFDNASATTDQNIKSLPMGVDSIISMHKKGWVG